MAITELREIIPFEEKIQSVLEEINDRFRSYNEFHKMAVNNNSLIYLDSGGFQSFDEREIHKSTVDTTDATVTTLDSYTPAGGGETVFLTAHVQARRTGGSAGTVGDGAAYVRKSAYQVVGSSLTVTIIGAIDTDFTAEDQAGWDCTFDVSSGVIRLRVTGAVNNNITWTGYLEIFRVRD